jgi:AMP nucleosidase
MPFQSIAYINPHTSASCVTSHTSVQSALSEICRLYEESCHALLTAFSKFINGDLNQRQPEQANYPFVGIIVKSSHPSTDVRLSYGVVDRAGLYATTLTRPDIFYDYYEEQLSLLLKHYPGPIYVGLSNHAIPLSFIVDFSTKDLTLAQIERIKQQFFLPDLRRVDDHVVNHTRREARIAPAPPYSARAPEPLALFTGERVDFSLHRLQHYTGTSPEHFQNFILLTNYQRYIREFKTYAHAALQQTDTYSEFIEPNNVLVRRDPDTGDVAIIGDSLENLPQMPAYHLKRPDHNGITLINIGIGPSNAKTITDHLAVLRPHCWLMLGHCAGLRTTQQLGDYVLAHGYVREDHVLDQDLPLWVPVPALAEVQVALQEAVAEVTGLKGHELKYRMRTGTVFTTDNRNWELRSQELFERFNQSRSIAVDMESATVAANGLRFRVPYGTLLCVSDKPIHGEIKLKGMANAFYEERTGQHLKIGIKALEIIRQRGIQSVHSRKLRGFDEPAFR